jgi:hypothetical protein
MITARIGILALAIALAGATSSSQSPPGATATLGGTAKDEARKPFPDYTVQAREIDQGHVIGAVPLTDDARFLLTGLPPSRYLIELIDRRGKVICIEGPFDMTQQLLKDDIVIDCGHNPALFWLLGAAGAAGVTSAVIIGSTASPAR